MTILELVVAVNIILLLSIICISKFDETKNKMNVFCRQFCSDIRLVRRINLLGNYNSYIVYTKNNNENGYILRVNGINKRINLLPKNVDIMHKLNIIKFKSDGSPAEKGSTIEISNKVFTRIITITPVSGRVLLKD